MISAAIIAAVWIAGGLIFINGAMRHEANESDQDFWECLAGLRRGDPAAIVATVLFVSLWPLVFIKAKLRL